MRTDALVILIGQSNAGGPWFPALFRAAGGTTAPQGDVREWSYTAFNISDPLLRDAWRPAQPSRGVVSGTGDFLCGVELVLAQELRAYDVRPSIIKVTHGGTSLADEWEPVAGTFYESFIDEVELALSALGNGAPPRRNWVVVWIQGEADALDATKAAAYEANLRALIAAVRRDLGVPRMPWLIPRLVDGRINWVAGLGTFNADHRLVVDAAQVAVCANTDRTLLVETRDLTIKIDNAHYTEASIMTLGRRLAPEIAGRVSWSASGT